MLRAEWVVFREIFCTLRSCYWRPTKRNSVFEEDKIRASYNENVKPTDRQMIIYTMKADRQTNKITHQTLS